MGGCSNTTLRYSYSYGNQNRSTLFGILTSPLYRVLLGKNYHDREVFSPQRPQSAQRKIFVAFVVQFWLRLTPRYGLTSEEVLSRNVNIQENP